MAFLVQPDVLCELPLSSAEYNALPFVDAAHKDTTTKDAEAAREGLLNLISDHGLSDVFSLHLLHTHFDVPEAQVMVYVTVHGPNHPTYQVMAPRRPEDGPSLRGRYFFAAPDGSLKAYEYSSDPQPDITHFRTFCSIFGRELIQLRMQDVFALGIRPYYALTNYTEVEIPDAHATVFVENLELAGSFETDWTNSKRWDEGLPLNQAKSGDGRCKRSRARHLAMGPESWAKDEQGNDVLDLEGHYLPAGCEAFNVLTNAMKYVSVM